MIQKKPKRQDSMSAATVRGRFAEVLNRVAYGKDRVLLTRRASPIAAIVPVEDLRLLEEMEDRADLEALRRARAEVRRKGTIPWEKLKKELDLD